MIKKYASQLFMVSSIVCNAYLMRCVIDIFIPLSWDNHWQGFFCLTLPPFIFGSLLVYVFSLGFDMSILALVLLVFVTCMHDAYFQREDTPKGVRDALSRYLCFKTD